MTNKKVQNNHIVGISNNILRNIESELEINNTLLKRVVYLNEVEHKNLITNYLLNPGEFVETDNFSIDKLHGNISFWAQSSGIITSNHIGVEILLSNDNILYETIPLNSQFVDSQTGTFSVFGNIKDIKPTYIRLRITNNDNITPDNFNVYLSF